MGKESDEIQQDIEATRGRMGETVDALAYKTNVPARVGDAVAEKKDAITGKVDQLFGRGKATMESTGDQTRIQARRAVSIAQENPFGLILGAAAVGVLVGMLLPSTRLEDEKMGEVADTVKDKAAETGREAFDRASEVAQEAAHSAARTAQESGSRHASEMGESIQQAAHDVAEQAGTSNEPPATPYGPYSPTGTRYPTEP